MTLLSPWTALVAAAVALPLLLLLYFLKLRRQTLRIPSTLLWRKSFEDLQVNAPFQRLRWSALLALQLLMLLALLLALAEPMWRGRSAVAARLVLVIDRGASMNAPASIGPDADGGAAPAPAQASGRRPQAESRLDAAKRAAIEIIDTIGSGRGGPSQIMVIVFGSSAQVVSTFESNRGVLRDLVNTIAPSDEQSNLEAALQLAGAFAGSRDEAGESGSRPPEVVLLSDGGVARGEGGEAGGEGGSRALTLRGGEFRFLQAASAPPRRDRGAGDGAAAGDGAQAPASPLMNVNNVGIVAAGARRDYDDPARVLVFARLINAGPHPHDLAVTLDVDGAAAATIRRRIDPAKTGGAPGEATLSHALDLPAGAILTLRHNLVDDLPADDVVSIVVPPPAKPRIAMVVGDEPAAAATVDDSPATIDVPTEDRPAGVNRQGPDPYLHELLLALDPQRIDVLGAGAWAQLDPAVIDSGARYDLVIFDRVSGHRLPGIPSISFGGVPAGATEAAAGADDAGADQSTIGQPILSWDRQHPVMRNLALDSIVYSGAAALRLADSSGATPLAYGRTPAGAGNRATSGGEPVIALLRTRGARHIVVAFAMARSNWPLHVSSAMFLQNALEFLTLAREGGAAAAAASAGDGLAYRPGETIIVRAAPDARTIVIEHVPRPSGPNAASPALPAEEPGAASRSIEVPAEPGAAVALPVIRHAGLYALRGAMPPHQAIAVNVLSEVESDIRPRESVTVNARAAEAQSVEGDRPLPLWPWLLAAALALAVIEWITYCRRVA